MDNILGNFYGYNIYKNWHCRFPIENLSLENFEQKIIFSESRIEQLSKRINLQGLSVLELGCLEGLHSLIVHNLGASKIIAIEGRKENFLKCLIVKNAFSLDRCKFIFGDLNEILPFLSGPFDLCLAIGILYHLEDPVGVIHRIAGLTDKLFVWTHYATEDFPKGSLVKIEYPKGFFCRGKYVREDTKNYLSSLTERSFWIFEDDIPKVLGEAGFKNIEIIQKEQHEHGPAMTFLVQK